jgi:hypothetical protein
MRCMLTFRVPPEEGNAAMKDGRFMPAFQSILEELRPEAAYLTPIEGARGGYLVINMDDASQIPAIVEPLFLGLGATVQIHPVFTPDEVPDLADTIEQAKQKYGQVGVEFQGDRAEVLQGPGPSPCPYSRTS